MEAVKYHWIQKPDWLQPSTGEGDWFLLDELYTCVASIGLKRRPNVEFENEVPDIEVVLLVAEKIKELGLDKGENNE